MGAAVGQRGDLAIDACQHDVLVEQRHALWSRGDVRCVGHWMPELVQGEVERMLALVALRAEGFHRAPFYVIYGGRALSGDGFGSIERHLD